MTAEQQIRQLIQQAAEDGRVPCKFLLDLARRTGSAPKDIGRLCNEMDIRIRACQLGCFK